MLKIIVGKDKDAEVVKLREHNKSIQQISLESGVSRNKIIQILQENGIGRHYNVTKKNKDSFQQVNGESFIKEIRSIRDILIERHLELKNNGDKNEPLLQSICIGLIKLTQKLKEE